MQVIYKHYYNLEKNTSYYVYKSVTEDGIIFLCKGFCHRYGEKTIIDGQFYFCKETETIFWGPSDNDEIKVIEDTLFKEVNYEELIDKINSQPIMPSAFHSYKICEDVKKEIYNELNNV
jgi:hypothetical protein